MPPQMIRITPILRMFDAAKARAFYLDFLGFTVAFEHRFEPDLPLYMRVAFGAATIDLSEHHGDGSPGSKIIIAMQGIEDYQRLLLAKRYGYARPGLQKQDLGETTMTIADPFYNQIVFSEPTT